MDFATYQMPFTIAGVQQMTQKLLDLLLLVDVAGNMHGADDLPRLVPQGSRRDKEMAAETIIMDFSGVRLAVGQS